MAMAFTKSLPDMVPELLLRISQSLAAAADHSMGLPEVFSRVISIELSSVPKSSMSGVMFSLMSLTVMCTWTVLLPPLDEITRDSLYSPCCSPVRLAVKTTGVDPVVVVPEDGSQLSHSMFSVISHFSSLAPLLMMSMTRVDESRPKSSTSGSRVSSGSRASIAT